jgi:NTE family protein
LPEKGFHKTLAARILQSLVESFRVFRFMTIGANMPTKSMPENCRRSRAWGLRGKLRARGAIGWLGTSSGRGHAADGPAVFGTRPPVIFEPAPGIVRTLLLFFCINVLLIQGSTTLAAQEPEKGRNERGPAKVGLVLSGGGARGAAHIGVLKVLEREHIPIDYIVGTSFGAIVGGLCAIGYSATEIEQIMQRQDWDQIFSDTPDRKLAPLVERKSSRYQGQLSFKGFSPELPTGLYGGQKLTEIIDFYTTERLLAADYNFDRLPIPFRAVATNLLNGKKYVFKEGRMTEALRASIAIPMLFTPVEKEGMLLVDGGLADNLPTDVARDLGADIIIAVDVTSPLMRKEEIRTFLNVMDQAISLFMQQSVEPNRKLADLVLHPDLGGFSYSDYGQFLKLIHFGEQEAEARLVEIRNLVAAIPPQTHKSLAEGKGSQIIESVTLQGLSAVKEGQLVGEIQAKPGNLLDPKILRADLGRLFSTRLFDSVDYRLERSEAERYKLTYLMKEAPLHTLGASIRFERDYKLVALAEFTARQLFGTPSTATITSIFGGLQDHSATLRYIPPSLPFLFIEPKIYISSRERLDIRDGELVDKFTDRRVGAYFMFGGTFFKRLEIKGGYRDDRVSINGGTPPNQQTGTTHLAGLTLRINRDTLDEQEFPHSGMYFNLQVDKRSQSLGSDASYSKWQGDIDRYIALSPKSTLYLNASAGYSRYAVPFYDRFFLGGYNFSEGGPRRLIGFSRDELAVSQMVIAGATYRRGVFSHPLSFARRGYLTAFYNVVAFSNREEAPYHAQILNGAGIGFALDTMLGPMRIAGGWGEGGRVKFYFSLGPAF